MLLVPLYAALVLTLFAWPSSNVGPRDLPLGVAGQPAAAQQVEHKLATEHSGAFDVHRYADEAAAREAIEDREVYGAIVATAEGQKVLTASAGSASVAQMLRNVAVENGQPEAVEDVVEAGPEGNAISSSVLPLMLAGIMAGVASSLLASGALRRGALLVAGSAFTGLAATAIVQSWLGVVSGDWLANAAGLSLTVLAIGATVSGLQAWLGQKGVVLGALTMILIGNPFSGVGTAPEMLPQPVGAIGQLLPPGAGGNLFRSTGFFDGAAAGGHVAVLTVWALGGLGLLAAAGLRHRRRESVQSQPIPAAA